jgi:hypothetical protein
MPNAILDPTGQAGRSEAGLRLAPRRADLQGATVGLLDNGKQNAALFLKEMGDVLVERYGASKVLMRKKTVFAAPAPPELLEELAGECDVVITGVGDCGSCSASAVADGVAFERRAIPAAVVCSDAFQASADAMAAMHGAPGYRYVTTAHPVAGLSPEQVRERAERAAAEVVSLLLARAERGAA